jgi:NO-binding membrane sensor protein with MHYT domain
MVATGTHNPYLVALSILVASFASYTALDLAARAGAARGLARRLWLVAAAITMGGGIWSMHFVAMLAFIMPIPVSYDIGLGGRDHQPDPPARQEGYSATGVG